MKAGCGKFHPHNDSLVRSFEKHHASHIALALVVKEIIDRFCQSIGYAINRFEVYQIRPAHGLGAAKMRQKGPFARGPNAWHLIQWRGSNRLGTFGPVGTNRKTVRLVSETLNKIEHGIITL